MNYHFNLNARKLRCAFVCLALMLSVPVAKAASVTVINATGCTMDTSDYDLRYFQFFPKPFSVGNLSPGQIVTADISLSLPGLLPNSRWIFDSDDCPQPQLSTATDIVFFIEPCAGCSAAPVDDKNDADEDSDCPQGLPEWSVSEPFISLWIRDAPVGYQPAIGARVSFGIGFNQRELTSGSNSNLFSLGKKWNFAWLSFVRLEADANRTVYFASGREKTFNSGIEYTTRTTLTGNTTNGFTLTNPDSSKTVYGFVVTNGTGAFQRAMMTETWNAIGQKTRFIYESYIPGNDPVIRLAAVIDGDGRTNTISYTTNNAFSTNLINRVTDPFGRFAAMEYDAFGRLTNLTDVANLSTTFSYDTNDWITAMITPYGTTSFGYTETSGTNVAPSGRSVLVTEPDGSRQLYLGQDFAPGVAASYSTNEVPVTTPFTNMFENTRLDQRNTFHWGRRQFAALSTTNIALLSTNDFRKARMKHWLFGETLSLERESSTDGGGTVEGQKTWYDYAGKLKENFPGTQSSPLFVAQVLPDGSTTFARTERNNLGYVTKEVSTYSSNSVVALRTNSFTFAANLIDLLRVTNAIGVRVLSNAYNGFHRVTASFNALNEKTAFTYDTSNRLSSTTLPTGLITTNIYGADGFVSKIIVTGIATNSFTYSNNLVLTHTDARGLTVTNDYDALQRLTRTSFPDGTSITNSYDKLDLVRTVDRMGFTNSFGYDALRRLTAVTNALGRYELRDYCSCGALNSVRDGAGNYTYFFYDNAGRETNTVSADGYSVTNTFNLIGQPIRRSDSAGTSVTNWFNNQGLPVTSSNAFGRLFLTTFDALNRATNSVDANGVTITNTFDNLNRSLTQSYPDGGVEKFGYTLNIAGATSATNQLNLVTRFGFDAASRLIAVTNANNEVTQTTYSGANDRLTLTDGKNQVTSFGFDIFGRPTSKTNAAGVEIERFVFDPNNRATNRWTPAKGNTIYSYDVVGNVTNVDYATSPDIALQYDSLNRMTNRTDAVGTTKLAWNTVSQLLSEDGPWVNDTIDYGYQNRLRMSLSLQQPSGTWTNGYVYDIAKRLTSITSPAGAFNYTYDATRQSLMTKLTLPNTAYITNSYDSMIRLLSTKLLTSSSSLLNAHSYGYNLASQRTTLTNKAGDYRNYTYDGAGQLKTALGYEANGSTRLNEKLGYAYDAAGNLNYRTNNAFLQVFAVNSLNELSNVTRSGTLTVAGNTTTAATNVTVNTLTAARYSDKTWAKDNFPLVDATTNFTAIAQSSIGLSSTNTVTVDLRVTNSFAFDLNGNLTSDGKRGFDYDDENELVRITVTNAWKTELTYDGEFRRRIRKEFAWQSGAWTLTNEVHYLFDGSQVIQERDGSNAPQVSYTRVGGRMLARTDNSAGTHAYYHTDGNRNVAVLINTAQLIVAKYLYDPFGNTLAISGPLAEANHYRFSSQEYHLNSGITLFLRRGYDSSLQRWLNQDPIGEAGGNNLFAYTLNDPVNYFDVNGEYTFSEWLQITGGFGEGLGTGLGNVGASAWGLVKSPYTITKSAAEAAGTLSTQYGRERFSQGVSTVATAAERFASDDCFRQKMLDLLGDEAKDYFTDPEKLSELLAEIGVAAGTAGAGLWADSARGAEKLAKLAKLLEELAPKGSKGGNKVDDLFRQIQQSGAKLQRNSKTAQQEGNVTLDFGSQGRINLRVETHPLEAGGLPVRHANVETVIETGGRKKIVNIHITK